jgi:chlorobactene glucosyltransferase
MRGGEGSIGLLNQAFMAIWIFVSAAIALVWASRHRQLSRARRSVRALTPTTYDNPPAAAPRVSILIAAKDEQDNIAACVRSFLAQDYPDFEVIVANDRSSDRTGTVLAEIQAQHADRLTIVTIRELRSGWFGKNNAMREAVAAAGGDYYCFADADCRQTSPRTLSMAMREIAEQRIDFLSVLPVLETRSFWERIIQPVCAAIMLLWFHPDRVNNPRSKAAYANGAFMLMSRSTYARIGGHEAVRQQVNEDTHMARLAKTAGLRLEVIQNEGLYVTRMYATFAQAFRGWSRIFYGCFGSVRRVLISLLVLFVFSIVPWASLTAVLVSWLANPALFSDGVWRALGIVAAAGVLFQQVFMIRFYRLLRIQAAYAFTYPFGALLGMAMLMNALLKASGTTSTTWRGTRYRAARVDRAPDAVASAAAAPAVRAPTVLNSDASRAAAH